MLRGASHWTRPRAGRLSLRSRGSSSRLLKNAVLRPNFRMFAMVTKGQRGDQRRRRRKIDYLFVSYFTLQTDSSRCGENFRDANQIVCRCRQHKEPFHQAASAMSGLAQAAHRLHPPERFVDAFALERADAIAGMASRARIDRRPAVGVVLRDVSA